MTTRWLPLLIAVIGVHGAARAAERQVLVVTAAPPLDAQRLADALRAYLDDYSVDVRTATAAPRGDLRVELAATEQAGAAVRAVAAVRIAGSVPGSAEIQLVDRVTDKSLVATVPRPQRDEDFYRTVALKVQALLRATLAEAPERLAGVPALARLAAGPAPPGAPAAERRVSLETAYALVAFPAAAVLQQGLAVTAAARLGPLFEAAAGIQALSPLALSSGDVSALIKRFPLLLAARLRLHRQAWELAAGPQVELALVTIDASSPTTAVQSGRSLAAAAGVQAGGRVRLGGAAWLYLRGAALGVIVGQRYTVRGQPLLALDAVQVNLEAGLGVAVW